MSRPAAPAPAAVAASPPARPERGRAALIQPAVLIAADLLALEIAFLVTYWFRFHAGIWKTPLGIPPLSIYLPTSAAVLLILLGLFYARGLYAGRAVRTFEEELLGLFKGVVVGSLVVLALAFFLRGVTYSRSFFGLFFLSCLIFLAGGRVVARALLRRVLRRGLGLRRVLLVGESPMRDRIVRTARELPGLALDIVGWAAAGPAQGRAATDLPCLGTAAELRRLVQEHGIDLVVMAVPFDQLTLVTRAGEDLANLNVDLQFVPDLLELRTSRMRLTEVAGIPFVSVREVALSGADRIVKRSFDLICVAAGMLLLAPVFILLALLVKATSRGPVFYRQARVGQDGREFQMLKFRTMRTDAEARSGPVWTIENDPRVTGVGRWLRRFSLDELPQLWNVLRGQMSLVGPRPERQVFVDRFSRQLPRYFERHRVKSGLTGWAQVNGLRGNTSIEERTLYDLHYVENWSLALDVRILLMTLHHVLRGDNAY